MAREFGRARLPCAGLGLNSLTETLPLSDPPAPPAPVAPFASLTDFAAIAVPVMPVVPADCLKCGVCCFSRLDAYVRVTGDDWARLGGDAERLAHFIGNRAYMRMRDGHCAALVVRRSAGAGGVGGEAVEYFCTAYECRPQVCRDLGRGSPECLGELASKASRVSGR